MSAASSRQKMERFFAILAYLDGCSSDAPNLINLLASSSAHFMPVIPAKPTSDGLSTADTQSRLNNCKERLTFVARLYHF
jgi:hypothetical protein